MSLVGIGGERIYPEAAVAKFSGGLSRPHLT